jgi:transketolase
VIELGIREQALVGAAAGMSLAGMHPIVHTYAPFLVERAFEQIKLDLVHNEAPATLVSIGASFDAAAEGRTHQAPGDVAMMLTLPEVEIHVPGHPAEAAALLLRSLDRDVVSYVRLAESENRQAVAADGLVHVVRDSGPAHVLAIGPTLDPVLEAVDGSDVSVVYASTVAPFDGVGVAEREPSCLMVVEPFLEGTMVASLIAAGVAAPIPIGVPRSELRRYGTAADHSAAHGLDAAGLRARIAALTGRVAVRIG